MKSLGNIIAFTLVLGLMAAIVYLMYQGTIWVWGNVDILNEGDRVILITAVVTTLLFAAILAWGMRSSASLRNVGQLSERRHDVYVHVLTVMRALLAEDIDEEQKQRLTEELVGANPDLMIVGSGKCLKSYMAFKHSFEKGELDVLPSCFQGVWKNMRKDMGYNDDFDVFDSKELVAMLPKISIESMDMTENRKALLPEA